MKDFEKFINGFRNFRRFYFDAENDYYASLNKGQHPKAIVIACSDSRADPALLMGCDPGDIFVVRNVANLVPHADDALRRDAVLAVLEYGASSQGGAHHRAGPLRLRRHPGPAGPRIAA